MSWTDRDKDQFFDAVKAAVMNGATPQDLFDEMEADYYLALDDIRKSVEYQFTAIRKGNKT